MRYDDPELQDLLAAEFVLGNLRGAARRRLVALMRRHASLSSRIEAWEERLYPLIAGARGVKPPARVWSLIQARVTPLRSSPWNGWGGWRVTSWTRRMPRRLAWAAVAGLVLALVVLTPSAPRIGPMVAVLSNRQAQPGIVVSWGADAERQQRIHVRVVAHPVMPAGTSWQAWLITSRDRDRAPIPLGFVTGEAVQTLEIGPKAAAALRDAHRIGVSVEPKGGSRDGRPSGAYLFEGPVMRQDG